MDWIPTKWAPCGSNMLTRVQSLLDSPSGRGWRPASPMLPFLVHEGGWRCNQVNQASDTRRFGIWGRGEVILLKKYVLESGMACFWVPSPRMAKWSGLDCRRLQLHGDRLLSFNKTLSELEYRWICFRYNFLWQEDQRASGLSPSTTLRSSPRRMQPGVHMNLLRLTPTPSLKQPQRSQIRV